MTAGLVLDVLSCVINDSINTGFNSFNVSLRSSSALKKTKTFIYYFCSSLIARAQSETSVPLRVKKVTETQTNTPLLLVDPEIRGQGTPGAGRDALLLKGTSAEQRLKSWRSLCLCRCLSSSRQSCK